MGSSHPIHQRDLAEDLVRLRRSDERLRSVASQRAGRIDPNPHQIDAVVFALSRLPEGGCILADEVGLGKTIEAGLVIAQRLAEGTRMLPVTPEPLLESSSRSFTPCSARNAGWESAGGRLRRAGRVYVRREFVGSERSEPEAWSRRLSFPRALGEVNGAYR